MAIPNPITLTSSLAVGQTAIASSTTVGGTWSSNNTAIATINGTTGLVTAISVGNVNIIYTVGSDSIATQLSVSTNIITNGFNQQLVYNALKDRITWQALGTASKSGRYFEDFHALCNLEILMAMQPDSTITNIHSAAMLTYVNNASRRVVMESINQVFNAPEIIDAAQLCFFRPAVTLYPIAVANQNNFVGLRMFVAQGDRAIKFSSVELFFNQTVTFNLYLYNDMTWQPYFVKSVTTSAGEQVIVQLDTDVILNYLTPNNNKGGVWYLGYYQQDLGTAQAMFYSVVNNQFHGAEILAYSGSVVTDPQGNRNFNRNIIGSNNYTYGMNVEVEIVKDSTNNIIQNQSLFDEVIGNAMAIKVIKDLIFSYRSNSVQRIIQGKSLDDLNGTLSGFRSDETQPYTPSLNEIQARAITQAKNAFQRKKVLGVGI